MIVHHCPYCELLFATSGELEWHLAEDHDGRLTRGAR
jgi:hypothetical protein